MLARDVGPGLPPIRLDPEKIKQALLNVLLNALNVLPDGGEIRLGARFDDRLDALLGPGVAVSIADTGPGISPEDIDFIFDPFFTRSPGGFGLGLSITHTIIEEHGGKVLVESEPDRGARFTIFLPANREEHGRNTGGG